MKRILLAAIFAAIGINASAQTVKEVTPTDVRMEKVENTLKVSFDILVPKQAVKQNYKLVLTPVLYKDSKELNLTPIVSQTRKFDIIEARQQRSLGYKTIEEQAMKITRGTSGRYEAEVPYESWMNGSALRLDSKMMGCCETKTLASRAMTNNVTFDMPKETPKIQARVVVVPKATEVHKEWMFSGKKELVVDFAQNKFTIDPNMGDNMSSLNEILKAVNAIKNSENLELNNIEIVGFASPEGTTEINRKLGGARANALKDYVQRNVTGLYDERFTLNNGAVNWDGLRKLVAASNMQHRDDVLYILDNAPTSATAGTPSRLTQLKNLKGGAPYQYMYKNLFPHLRNACYIHVYYDVIKDAEADVINSAVEMIRNGEYTKALPKLQTVKNDPRAWNPMGVCYMMIGDTAAAKNYLSKAAENGNEDAKSNLNELKKLVK